MIVKVIVKRFRWSITTNYFGRRDIYRAAFSTLFDEIYLQKANYK